MTNLIFSSFIVISVLAAFRMFGIDFNLLEVAVFCYAIAFALKATNS